MPVYAVGPAWAGFALSDKQAMIRAFGRLSAASYAYNFDSFSRERSRSVPSSSAARTRW